MESSRFRLQESVSGEETGTLTRSRLGYDLAGSRKRNNIFRESLCNLRCGPQVEEVKRYRIPNQCRISRKSSGVC